MVRLVLEVTSGMAAGKKYWLRAGQTAVVGRGQYADFLLPHDPQVADEHCRIGCGPGGCHLTDLSAGRTWVNGEPASELDMRHGDCVVVGETRLRVALEGETAPIVAAEPLPAPESEEIIREPDWTERPAEPIAVRIPQNSTVRELLAAKLNCGQFVEALVEREFEVAAVQFLAHALPPAEGVRWARACCEQITTEVSVIEGEALAAAESWFLRPADESARAGVAAAAEKLTSATAPGVLLQGLAAFNAENPDATAPQPGSAERLATVVAGVVLMAAVTSDVEPDARRLMRRFARLAARHPEPIKSACAA